MRKVLACGFLLVFLQPALAAEPPAGLVRALRVVTYPVPGGQSLGSGVAIAVRDGYTYVLTAKHCCPPAGGAVWVNKVRGEVVAVDPKADLGLLKIRSGPEESYADVAADEPAEGTAVYQVGYGHGKLAYREGKTVGYRSFGENRLWNLHLGFPVVGGDSGSPVFRKEDGKVVAIVWGSLGTAYCVGVTDINRFLAANGEGRER
jgi:S1-C subfamily serine protease